MKKLCRFEVFLLPSRHPARPMPAGRPDGSGAWPASSPAHAGWQAGWLGGLAGFPPSPCRLPGRLAQLGRSLLSFFSARAQPTWPIAASPTWPIMASPRPLASARSPLPARAPSLAPAPFPRASLARPAPALLAACCAGWLPWQAGPACWPAHAGWQAGWLGQQAGMQAGPCRLPGRLSQPSTFFPLKRLVFLLGYIRVFCPCFFNSS